MIAFEVNDMTCGHCVSALTQALKAADQNATVQIDLARHRVQVESSAADEQTLAEAIKEAGYTPVRVAAGAAPAAGRTAGGCCGCR